MKELTIHKPNVYSYRFFNCGSTTNNYIRDMKKLEWNQARKIEMQPTKRNLYSNLLE